MSETYLVGFTKPHITLLMLVLVFLIIEWHGRLRYTVGLNFPIAKCDIGYIADDPYTLSTVYAKILLQEQEVS